MIKEISKRCLVMYSLEFRTNRFGNGTQRSMQPKIRCHNQVQFNKQSKDM